MARTTWIPEIPMNVLFSAVLNVADQVKRVAAPSSIARETVVLQVRKQQLTVREKRVERRSAFLTAAHARL